MQYLCQVEEIEFLLDHAETRIFAVFEHCKQSCERNRSCALFPHRILFVFNRNQSGNEVVQIFIHFIKRALFEHLYSILERWHIRIRLAVEDVPFVSGFKIRLVACRSVFAFFVFFIVHEYVVLCVDVFLIVIPNGIQRIPTIGRICVAQVDDFDVITAFFQKTAVQGEQLALWVGHNHRRACRRRAEKLNHRIDEGRRFTTTGRTDDDRVARRVEQNFHILVFVCEFCHDRDAVFVAGAELAVFNRFEDLFLFVFRQPARVFKVGFHLFEFALSAYARIAHKLPQISVDKAEINCRKHNEYRERKRIKTPIPMKHTFKDAKPVEVGEIGSVDK